MHFFIDEKLLVFIGILPKLQLEYAKFAGIDKVDQLLSRDCMQDVGMYAFLFAAIHLTKDNFL